MDYKPIDYNKPEKNAEPEQIITDRVLDLEKRNYLLNVYNLFSDFITARAELLLGRKRSDIEKEAAIDLTTDEANLSKSIITTSKITDATEFYQNPLVAHAWVVDHASKTDFYKGPSQKLVEEALHRVDAGEIVGANDGKVYLLEIGPGHARDFHFLARKQPRIKYVGVDISPAMVDIAQKLNPDGEFIVGDVLKLDELIPQKQAAVFSAAVLHHLSDHDKNRALSQIRNILADNGLLFLSLRLGSVPQFDPETGLTYFGVTEEYLKELLNKNGFTELNTKISGSPRGVQYLNTFASAIPKKNSK